MTVDRSSSPDDGRSVTRYLGFRAREVGDPNGPVAVEGSAEVSDHVRGPAGGARAGALLTLIDSIGGWCGGLAALPDGWVVSTNLTMRTARLDHRGPLRLAARELRKGRAAVVSDVRVHDTGADDALVAEATLTAAVLVPEGGPPPWERPAVLHPPPLGDEIPPPLLEAFGVRTGEDDSVELELRPELRNPWGIVHGGVTATLVDAATEWAVERATGVPAATVDAAVHYLAPGRVGPLRAEAVIRGARTDGHVARVEVRDRGADDRLLVVAVTTARPLTGGGAGDQAGV